MSYSQAAALALVFFSSPSLHRHHATTYHIPGHRARQDTSPHQLPPPRAHTHTPTHKLHPPRSGMSSVFSPPPSAPTPAAHAVPARAIHGPLRGVDVLSPLTHTSTTPHLQSAHTTQFPPAFDRYPTIRRGTPTHPTTPAVRLACRKFLRLARQAQLLQYYSGTTIAVSDKESPPALSIAGVDGSPRGRRARARAGTRFWPRACAPPAVRGAERHDSSPSWLAEQTPSSTNITPGCC